MGTVGTVQPELPAGEDADVHWFERKDGGEEHLPGTEADQAVSDGAVQAPEVLGELVKLVILDWLRAHWYVQQDQVPHMPVPGKIG